MSADIVARLVAHASGDIESGRFDAVRQFQQRYGKDFEGAGPELRAKLLAIRDGGVERSLPQPRQDCAVAVEDGGWDPKDPRLSLMGIKPEPTDGRCTVPGCEAPAQRHSLCAWHDPGEGEA